LNRNSFTLSLYLIPLFALSLWYFTNPISEALIIWFARSTALDPFRATCWILTALHYGTIALLGLLLANPLVPFCTIYAFEYGFLFQVTGKTQYGTYPFGDFILLEGVPARVFAWVTAALAVVIVYLYSESQLASSGIE
jgi:hypothetical protein